MPSETHTLAAEMVERYTDQPAEMPPDVRAKVESVWGGLPVQLYALSDLDASMKLAHTWLALGPEHVALAREREGGEVEVTSFERSKITAVRVRPGLSSTTLTILGCPDEGALAVVRFTYRQRKAIENVQYVIEQALEGRDVPACDPSEAYAEAVAHPLRAAQASVHVNRLAVVWRLLGYLRRYRGKVVGGMAAATVLTALSLVPPYLTGFLIDSVLRPFHAGELTRDAASRLAYYTAAAIAIIYGVQELLGWARLRLMATLGEDVSRDIRTVLYEHLQKLSLGFYSKKRTGSIISRVTSDTDRLWHFIAYGIVEMSLAFVMLVGLGAVLISLDPVLGTVMVVPVPLLLFMLARHSAHMQLICLKAWRKWSALTGRVSDAVAGVRVVKAFNQEPREKRRFDAVNNETTLEFQKIHIVWTGFWPRLMVVLRAVMVVVWLLAIPRLFATEGADGALSTGAFVAFLLYMTMFIEPFHTIGQMTQMLNRATTSAHRIFEILDTKPEIAPPANPKPLDVLQGRVAFENVGFAYDGVRQVLKGVSFDVAPGEMIGLVGPSGAGKTTIVNLIARFYDATSGSVLIDGIDIRELDTGQYRQRIGMVLQDPYLFYGTILDNIRYGVPEASVDRVIEAAKAANVHDFVCKLQHGYETIVGERGHTLSGGERQRVSIARAILGDPKILILDEATSSVDTESEQKIQEALDRLVPGRTVFAIAHRLSTLKRANRLFVIEDGRLTEFGTHAELVVKPQGTYRKFYEMQRESRGTHVA